MNELINFLVSWARPFPLGAPIRTRRWSMESLDRNGVMLRMDETRSISNGPPIYLSRALQVTEEQVVTADFDMMLELARQAARELEAAR